MVFRTGHILDPAVRRVEHFVAWPFPEKFPQLVTACAEQVACPFFGRSGPACAHIERPPVIHVLMVVEGVFEPRQSRSYRVSEWEDE